MGHERPDFKSMPFYMVKSVITPEFYSFGPWFDINSRLEVRGEIRPYIYGKIVQQANFFKWMTGCSELYKSRVSTEGSCFASRKQMRALKLGNKKAADRCGIKSTLPKEVAG